MTQGIEQQTTTYAREYVMRVETGIPEIRDGIFALMEKDLISSASVGESKELNFKMKGVSRILAEPGKRRDETAGDVEGCGGGGDGGERSQGKTPCVGGNGRTGWDLRVDKFGEMMAVASEPHGPAMMWARPTCTSLACCAGSFLLASMLFGVEPLQHLALAHAIVFPLPLRAEGVSTRSVLQASFCEAWHHAVT